MAPGARNPLRLALPALALLVPAALVWSGGFDGLYGQDPYAYYNYAADPLRASLLRLEPLPPFFWPPGYPLLVALLSLPLGVSPLLGQAVSLAMGAASAAFTALLAAEVWRAAGNSGGRAHSAFVPLAAGLLTAFNGQLWQSSAVVMADTTGLAAAALGAWAVARYCRVGRGRWLALAGAGLAAALLSRWIYGLLFAPAAAAVLLAAMRRPEPRWRSTAVHIAAAALAAVVVLSPMLLPAARGVLGRQPAEAAFAGNFDVYRWSPANALRREFVTSDGLLSYRLPNGLYYAAAPAHPYYFTPLMAVFILPGLWALVRQFWRAPWAALLILGWAALVYAFHAGAAWQNFRFTLAYLPPLAVLAAIGLESVLLRWPRQPRPRLAAIVLGLGLLVMALGGANLTRGFIVRKQAELAIVRAVEARLPPDARLLAFGLTSTMKHYSRIETLELYHQPPETLPRLLADSRPAYLLVPVGSMDDQWRDMPLGASYRALRDGPGLEVLEHFDALTLFRVGHAGGP